MRQWTGFLTIYWRDMLRFFRFKTLLFSSLVQPALWLAFFGIAMSANFARLSSGMAPLPGIREVGYLTFMAAGVIALTTLFTSLFAGIVILFDKNWGLMREVMASPLPREHVIVGIGLSGMTKSFIQVSIITVFGILIGVEFFSGYTAVRVVASLLGMFLFVGIFSLGFVFLSSAIAASLESPEGLQGIMTLLSLPLFFVSNALYPAAAFPPALNALSAANPLTHLINAVRYFTIGPDFQVIGVHYAVTVQDMVLSFGVLIAFAAATFGIALWRFGKAVVT